MVFNFYNKILLKQINCVTYIDNDQEMKSIGNSCIVFLYVLLFYYDVPIYNPLWYS